jgi:hypothetical protein
MRELVAKVQMDFILGQVSALKEENKQLSALIRAKLLRVIHDFTQHFIADPVDSDVGDGIIYDWYFCR